MTGGRNSFPTDAPPAAKRRRNAVWLALTLLWMALIFSKSSEPYAQQDMRPWLANVISEAKLKALLPNWSFTYDGQSVAHGHPYEMAEFFIRKAGHVAEYALLAWLWMRTMRTWPAGRSRLQAAAIAAAISIVYAASDEWHQTFVPGRTGHAVDVAVDAAGVAAAMLAEAAASIVLKQKKK
ncbi:VanZ family protein [Gordoniibacillus kamchatkensis]|uniref:VanZ family protein n=1 Tax=Gordoniibacillus kamchatkensis TaxID=1590651 RepID=UPI0009E56AAE|nr:VanZ family protein [Paenibacillus sp. VKM B-2647]